MAAKLRPAEPVKELVPADDPYPLPSEPQVLEVTQEMASSWLSYRGGHPKLRPLSKAVAAGYQELMEAGEFREATPEGLIFDTDGYGISFQHRMKALANASTDALIEHYGRPWLKFWVFPNQSRDIAPYLDQGFRRTAAHILVGKPYAKDIGSGARYLAALADGDRFGMPRFNRVKVPETVSTARKWPELEWYPSEAWAVWRAAGVPTGAHLAVLAQAARTDHRVKIESWLEGLRRGANLSEKDPRLMLRERFHGGFVSLGQVNRRDHQYALIVKAWNAYVTGQPLTGQGFRFKVGELLPKVEGFGFEKKGRTAA
ncbi:hypothetical protein ACGF8D_10605 [Streptomyces massasporeus]|uniref:hypothetical protein n=1 Tax=Streptomyces massasporeus TaxID=67324 RepID=UPI0037101CC4